MHTQALVPGALLQNGKYKIVSVIGQGGFGITYEAYQKGLDRKVAIKEFFIPDCCGRDVSGSIITVSTSGTGIVDRCREKFRKEAKTIAGLNHSHIVRVSDIFEENNTVYYVMDYIEGQSLTDHVRNNGPMSESKSLDVIKQVCSALSYMHSKNILHLDIKPSNLMFDSNGHVTVIDFGISKHYDDEGGATTTSPIGRSKGYAPREQYSNDLMKTLAPNTDIYAVGATLLFLLTGKVPEESIIREDDNDLVIPSYISTNVASAIRKSMSLSRKNRYQSIEKFQQAINTKSVSLEEKTIIETKNIPQADRINTLIEASKDVLVKPEYLKIQDADVIGDISNDDNKTKSLFVDALRIAAVVVIVAIFVSLVFLILTLLFE